MGKSKPNISVIVPVFNVESCVATCIRSILNQSFDNFELILVDDGSTDKSFNICKGFAKSDRRIRLFHKENGGLSDARNYGIDRSNAEYVVFVDSDDYIDENYLLVLYNRISKTNVDVAICGFDWVDNNKKVLYRVSLPSAKSMITGHELLKKVFDDEGYAFVVAWNKIYKKSVFDNLRFEKGRLFEDEFLNFKLFWYISKVALCSERLYYYVQRQESITNSRFSLKKFEDFNDLHEERIAFYKSRSKDLYLLSNYAYRLWMIDTLAKESQNLNITNLNKLQENYRLSVKNAPASKFGKMFFVDCIAWLNLGVMAKLKSLIKLGKE